MSAALDFEPYIDQFEAASYTGLKTRTLLKWTRNGEVPAHRLGGGKRRHTWRFRKSELDVWMDKNRNHGDSERDTNGDLLK